MAGENPLVVRLSALLFAAHHLGEAIQGTVRKGIHVIMITMVDLKPNTLEVFAPGKYLRAPGSWYSKNGSVR